MGIDHRFKPPFERLNVRVKRDAVLAHASGNDGNSRKQILDVMIECGDQLALLIRGPLACRDVESKALQTYQAPDVAEFSLSCFLEPDHLAVRLLETKGNDIS